MRELFHRLAHVLGLSLGYVHTFERDGHWYLTHRCQGCAAHSVEIHLTSCPCHEGLEEELLYGIA